MALRSSHSRYLSGVLEAWNRRLHYYLGLYFLLFLWLFSFTGLLLNHPRWALSRIPNEAKPAYERNIDAAVGATDIERANDMIRKLGLRGEIDWPRCDVALGHRDGRPCGGPTGDGLRQLLHVVPLETAANAWVARAGARVCELCAVRVRPRMTFWSYVTNEIRV